MAMKWIKRLGVLATVSTALLYAAGCENMHGKDMKAAEARWSRARAAVMLQLAQQQYEGGQLDKALVTIGKAVDLDAGLAPVQVLRGQILAEKGQSQQAVAALELAIALDARCAEAHYQCGVQYERWGQFAKALERFESAVEIAPSNTAYAVAAVETLAQLDRVDEALDLADKCLSSQEQSVALRVSAGEICLARGDYASAAKYFREASRLATGDTEVLRSLAMSLYYAKQYDQAVGCLEQLVRQPADAPPDAETGDAGVPAAEDPAVLLAALGDCYLALGEPGKARDVFAQMARLHPQRVATWENLAKVALHEKRYLEALTAADQALVLSPGNVTALLVRGYALISLNRPAEAVKDLQAARRSAPRDVLVLCLLADAYCKSGDRKSSREVLTRALQIAPTDKLANKLLSELAAAEVRQDPPAVSAGVVVP